MGAKNFQVENDPEFKLFHLQFAYHTLTMSEKSWVKIQTIRAPILFVLFGA
jgi:hypothetical protein